MLENQSAAQGASAAEEANLLDSIIEQSRAAKSDSEHVHARNIIGELVSQVLSGTVVVFDNLSATLDARVVELDCLISQ